MGWLAIAADICGVLGALFALYAGVNTYLLQKKITQEQERLDKKIKVILQYGEKSFELPVELRRAELTRSEILGRLGMIPIKAGKELKPQQPRFSLRYTNKPEFWRQIDNITASDGEHIITIPCSEEEFNQFDI